MSALRRLAAAGAFALPLSLVIACPANAGQPGRPDDSWSAESSGNWAGIGGAGTTDTEEGSDWWGHHWSDTETAVAGIGAHHVVGHPDPVADEAPAAHPVYDTDDDADDVGYAAE